MKTLIISDFSKTFTDPSCPTSWSAFAKSGLLGDKYTGDRDDLYEANRHFEEEGNIEMTQKWFHDHAELFAEYGLTKETIEKVVTDDSYFKPRKGIAEFLQYIRANDIPLKIVTSGVTDFVKTFFEARWFGMENIEIYGNELVFDGNLVVGVDRSKGIVPIDKSNHPFEIAGYARIVLLGDGIEDLSIAKGPNVESFGFTDEDIGYDVKLGKNGDFGKVVTEIARA